MGKTSFAANANPLNRLDNGSNEGCWVSEKCWGTYMHGILDNPLVIDDLLAPFAEGPGTTENYNEFKQKQYKLLAAHIRQNVDMDAIYKMLQK